MTSQTTSRKCQYTVHKLDALPNLAGSRPVNSRTSALDQTYKPPRMCKACAPGHKVKERIGRIDRRSAPLPLAAVFQAISWPTTNAIVSPPLSRAAGFHAVTNCHQRRRCASSGMPYWPVPDARVDPQSNSGSFIGTQSPSFHALGVGAHNQCEERCDYGQQGPSARPPSHSPPAAPGARFRQRPLRPTAGC